MTHSIPFLEALENGPLLCDGATGTLLHAAGVSLDHCLDEVNLSRPELVLHMHSEYLAAGADVIETNTFGANRFKLGKHSADDRVAEINSAAVSVARRVISVAPRGELQRGP